MRPAAILGKPSVWLAVLSLCAPSLLGAAPRVTNAPVIHDVVLRDGGTLLGQVVDPQGIARANVPVTIATGAQRPAVAQTNKSGYFAFSGLSGGVYRIQAGERVGLYRVWSARTAPPAAEQGVLVVDGTGVLRGQPGAGLGFWLASPQVLIPVAAVAVAVPVGVVLANQEDEPATP